ncbi:hypothetical protein BS50DRAFT_578573 [Corynespora cassiicola Philippines]|uniref:Uncharacterized protein n=1 Tax=Corynespora cassiicola Philippines TaxID=1448308 RepID=A0A2T2N6V5_CORCC|nr:hypothetical protein BS50DRAFT_578573 [Corynespora cassiicola Philippines]
MIVTILGNKLTKHASVNEMNGIKTMYFLVVLVMTTITQWKPRNSGNSGCESILQSLQLILLYHAWHNSTVFVTAHTIVTVFTAILITQIREDIH